MNESKQTIPANLTRVAAAEVFSDAPRLEEILSEIESAARAIVPNVHTAKGRKSIAGVAAKVARSKTYLDGVGKDLVSGLKKQAGAVDARRRMLRERLDALKAEVRQPLTDYEQAEADRQAAIRERIAEIRRAQEGAHLLDPETASSAAVATVIKRVEAIDIDESFQEFRAEAQQTKDAALNRLAELRSRVQAREEAETKAEAERKAREEQERKEREQRIAAEAADKAKREAELEAKQEAERKEREAAAERERQEDEKRAADQARLDAQQAAREAEQSRLAAERRARESEQRRQQEAAEAEARAKRRAEDAARQERERIAAARKAEEDAAAKRAADREHRAQVNRDAAAELVMHTDIAVEQARAVVTAIARGLIPQVSINY